MKTITSILCAVALLGTLSFAADKPAEKKPCCAPSVEAGLKCDHKCCAKAAKANKVCETCHPAKAGDKKK